MVSLSEILSNLFNPGPQGPQFQIQGEFSRRNLVTPSPVPPPPPPIDNRAEIFFFQGQLNEALGFLRDTFKTPPKRQCGGPGQFSCGRLNFSPQPRGARFGIDPFSGQRIALPVGPRGNVKTVAFFGGQAQLNLNVQRIEFGNLLQGNVKAFIAELRSKIGLLRTEQTI